MQASRISSIWSVQGASPSAPLHSLIFGPWCACRAPPVIRSCKPASAALLLLILLLSLSPNLALGLQARLLPLPPPPNACARNGWPCAASQGETARWWSNPGWRQCFAWARLWRPVAAPASRGGGPLGLLASAWLPLPLLGVRRWPRGPANANSQGWGPQDPKRPGGPPFSWDPVPYVALWARLPLFYPPRLCHVRVLLP